MTRVIGKIIIGLCAVIMIMILLICVIVFIALFRANETEISDETAFRLINAYFDIDLNDRATVVHKDYGTNIREEFFTIIVQCSDMNIVENYIETADSYITASGEIDNIYSAQQILPSISGFYCMHQWNDSGRWTHRIMVGDDKEHIVFDYDP